MKGAWCGVLLWCACAAHGADAEPGGTAAGADFVGTAADFVGTAACTGCHEAEHAAWIGSHHDLAMQQATPDTVLGDFGDAEFVHGGVTSTFFRRDGAFFVRTDGPDGELNDYRIAYTFGVTPLQQYLIPMADGRVQALGVAWDARSAADGGQRWFHLYPDEQIDHDDPLHWTGQQQNWNYMCAGCHSTNLDKGFDPAANRFATTWTDIDVGCEACHGPGADHLAWAALDGEARGPDAGFAVALSRVSPAWQIDPATGSAKPREAGPAHSEVGVCADCHSRRGEIAARHEAAPHFLDNYMPALLTEGLYHADGQIEDEVFVWGSFTQSRMFQAGVTCSDCHEPHSQQLRAPGDAVCAQCHLPAKFATESHHHHPAESAGARCANCHMPETTYMVVDPRRDHSLRIPRPDLSVILDTPNACNRCHEDQTSTWAADHVGRWHPDGPQGLQTWAKAFAAARAGDPRAERPLLEIADDPKAPDIARATALLELQPFLSPVSAPALENGLKDTSALVRIAGLRSLEALPPEHRYRFAADLLSDDRLAVRVEAGRVLAAVPRDELSEAERDLLDAAVADYAESQMYNAERPESHTSLGTLHMHLGDPAAAEAAFRKAIAIDPTFSPAYVNLADMLRTEGRDTDARAVLEAGIEQAPEDAALQHALGLLRVRTGDAAGALDALQTANRLDPDSARFAYVYAIAQNSTGDRDGALRTLREALTRHPYDRDILFGLAALSRDAGDLTAARRYAARMTELRPQDSEAAQFLQGLGPPL